MLSRSEPDARRPHPSGPTTSALVASGEAGRLLDPPSTEMDLKCSPVVDMKSGSMVVTKRRASNGRNPPEPLLRPSIRKSRSPVAPLLYIPPQFRRRLVALYLDVDLIADGLAANKKTRKSAERLRRLKSLNSIILDLTIAKSAIDTLVEATNSRSCNPGILGPVERVTDGGLFAYFLILYARATEVSSSKRSSYDPTRHYDENLKKIHKNLIHLRHEAIAHYGHAKSEAGPWSKDDLYLAYEPETDIISFKGANSRFNFRAESLYGAYIIIPVALQGAQTDREALYRKIWDDFRTFSLELQNIIAKTPRSDVDESTLNANLWGYWTPKKL